MKHLLRKKLKQIRTNTTTKYINMAESKIRSSFLEFMMNNAFTSIAGYYPIKNELNTLPILIAAEEHGITIALPALDSKIEALVFKKWKTQDKVKENGLFQEPEGNSPIIKPDLIIVPLLGFDRNGHRLGYGSGYYDRTLPKYKKSLKIALAYSNQELNYIPAEEHDQRLDYIITEKEIIKIDE